MDPESRLSLEEEKRRYLQHNNDVNDIRYQNFVKPIVNFVIEHFEPVTIGLDFGCGTGPVISKLLCDRAYKTALFDPFFYPDHELLKTQYDYIICCEVMEHFRTPATEFNILRSLLKPEGALICMTELWSEDKDFDKWHYNNDPTHHIFYNKNTLKWISKKFNFSSYNSDDRLVVFKTVLN